MNPSDKDIRADIETGATPGIGTLRALLDTPARDRRFSPSLEREFRAHMIEKGFELNRDSAWLMVVTVPVAYAALYGLITFLSTPQYLDANLPVLNRAIAWITLFAMTIVLMERLPAVKWLYPVYTVFAWSGLIGVVCISTASLPDPYLRSLAGFVAAILILVIFSLGVFDIRLTLLSALLGTLAAWGYGRVAGHWFDTGFFIGYAVLPIVVGTLVAHLIEMRDRTSFLQSRLLAAEKIVIDRYASEVERLSQTDALTGLANRRHFNQALDREWLQARRQRREIALLFIDVDYFKTFNDTYGHQKGDEVLSAIGGVLARCVKRPSDLPARYGGEEFVILLPDTSMAGAQEVARVIAAEVAALAIAHAASKVSDHVTLSIGIAARVPDEQSPSHELTAAADAAVYAAKSGGRNRIALASSAAPNAG